MKVNPATPMGLLRWHLQINQLDLAKVLGISNTWVSAAESGMPVGAETTRSVLKHYSNTLYVLGLTAEDFIRGAIGGAEALSRAQAAQAQLDREKAVAATADGSEEKP